jgi:hypothetical protein
MIAAALRVASHRRAALRAAAHRTAPFDGTLGVSERSPR